MYLYVKLISSQISRYLSFISSWVVITTCFMPLFLPAPFSGEVSSLSFSYPGSWLLALLLASSLSLGPYLQVVKTPLVRTFLASLPSSSLLPFLLLLEPSLLSFMHFSILCQILLVFLLTIFSLLSLFLWCLLGTLWSSHMAYLSDPWGGQSLLPCWLFCSLRMPSNSYQIWGPC